MKSAIATLGLLSLPVFCFGQTLCISVLAAGCTCGVSGSSIVFSASSPRATVIDGAGQIQVTCQAQGTGSLLTLSLRQLSFPYQISLGPAASGRAMLSASGAALSYQLFKNPSRTDVWGTVQEGLGYADSMVLPLSVSILGLPLFSSGARTHFVYGRAYLTPQTMAGSFNDTVIIRIDY